jgi:polar amino acid transport system substrate-binding protein
MKTLFFIFSLLLAIGVHANEPIIHFTPDEMAYIKEKKEITMCVDPDWEPFEVINTKGEHEGIAADLISLVSKRIGMTIRLIPTKTWEETLVLSKTGKCDILSFVNQTPEREKWLIFTQPLLSDPNILITREDHPFIANLNGVNHESVVLPAGTAMLERMRKDFSNLRFISVVSEGDAMKMVSEKKADMTVRSLIVAAYVIKKEGWFNLKISGQPLGYENHLRMGILKNEPKIRDILNKGISTITPIEREIIINKHTGLVVQKGIGYKTVILTVLGLLSIIGLIALLNYLLRRKIRFAVAKELQMKEQLLENSKKAEIGNMVANISHQWREPLSKLSSINLLIMAKLRTNQLIEDKWLLKQSQELENTLDFMSLTMQNFLDFYKKSSTTTTFSVVQSIEAVFSIMETKLLDNSITIGLHVEQECMINGIKNEWMQVWLNLLNNAVRVLVERKIVNPTITIVVTSQMIQICDNGGGLKDEKENNGLGILMCKEILNKYEAELILSNVEEGLCAKIVLKA